MVLGGCVTLPQGLFGQEVLPRQHCSFFEVSFRLECMAVCGLPAGCRLDEAAQVAAARAKSACCWLVEQWWQPSNKHSPSPSAAALPKVFDTGGLSTDACQP